MWDLLWAAALPLPQTYWCRTHGETKPQSVPTSTGEQQPEALHINDLLRKAHTRHLN